MFGHPSFRESNELGKVPLTDEQRQDIYGNQDRLVIRLNSIEDKLEKIEDHLDDIEVLVKRADRCEC